MKDDTIKRSDAIKALCDAVDNKGDYEGEWLYTDEFCKAIDSVPSTDRPQEWIPCSERLPKENTEVLMSLEWGVDIGEYRNGEWHSEWINHYDDGNVLAWMPLPKMWEGAGDE